MKSDVMFALKQTLTFGAFVGGAVRCVSGAWYLLEWVEAVGIESFDTI